MTQAISRFQLLLILLGSGVVSLLGGGYSEKVRLAAGIAAWALVLAGLVLPRRPLPSSVEGVVALAGLAALALLTGLSLGWTPLRTAAKANLELCLLYLGAFMAMVPALRDRWSARLIEPAVVVTAIVAALWGLSERVMPRVFDLGPVGVTGGRLSEPLGYWNSLGALTGLGLVLAARIAADSSRPRSLRVGASAGFPVLACALFMTYSRGGLAVTAAGLVALIAFAPTWRQLLVSAAAPATGVAAAIVATQSREVRLLTGTIAERSSAGEALGIVLVGSVLVAGVGAFLLTGRSAPWDAPIPRWGARAALLVAFIVLASPIVAALLGTASDVTRPSQGQAGITRLQTADSDRQLYWKIAWEQFASHPLKGTGSGAFRLAWVQSRYAVARPAVNAHSLEVETAAELGALGLLGLAMLVGGLLLAGRKALERDRVLTAGLAAGGLMMLGHTAFDWDWQLPGIMLPGMLVLSGLVAQADHHDTQLRRSAASRATVAVLALLACAWLYHDWRSAHLIEEAGSKLDAARVLGFTADRRSSIDGLLTRADWLSVDSEAPRARAITAILAGDTGEGVNQLKQILADDPYDYLSWVALARVSFRTGNKADLALAQRALQAFHPSLTGDGSPQAR